MLLWLYFYAPKSENAGVLLFVLCYYKKRRKSADGGILITIVLTIMIVDVTITVP